MLSTIVSIVSTKKIDETKAWMLWSRLSCLNCYAVDEAGDPWIGCAFEEVLGRAVEADFAVLQEEHAVRCFPCEVKVVRHDDHG